MYKKKVRNKKGKATAQTSKLSSLSAISSVLAEKAVRRRAEEQNEAQKEDLFGSREIFKT